MAGNNCVSKCAACNFCVCTSLRIHLFFKHVLFNQNIRTYSFTGILVGIFPQLFLLVFPVLLCGLVWYTSLLVWYLWHVLNSRRNVSHTLKHTVSGASYTYSRNNKSVYRFPLNIMFLSNQFRDDRVTVVILLTISLGNFITWHAETIVCIWALKC
jgi:hypothetical protein